MDIEELKSSFSGNEWPRFNNVEMQDHEIELKLEIRPDIRWFEGHFPEQPVLAGVVQTHWAATLGTAIFCVSSPFSRIDNLKFQSVILPDMHVTLRLNFDENKSVIKFQYFEGDTTYSEGKIVFAS